MVRSNKTGKDSNEKSHTEERKPVAWIIKGVDKEALKSASVHHPIICECGKKLTSNGGVATSLVLLHLLKCLGYKVDEGINGTLDISKEESVL